MNSQSIKSNPRIFGGDACIRDTRIPVWLIVDMLSEMTAEEVIAQYPGLTKDDIDNVIYYNNGFKSIVDGQRARHVSDSALEQAVVLLNELLKIDPEAIGLLVNYRVPINEALLNDTTLKVTVTIENQLGILGILNGLGDSQDRRIAAVLDAETQKIERFTLTDVNTFR